LEEAAPVATTAEELSSLLTKLSPRDQERVLSFVRELAHPPAFPRTPLPSGSPPEALLRFRVTTEVGEAMERAQEDCERIWPDE
jgi:hypothetical protein